MRNEKIYSIKFYTEDKLDTEKNKSLKSVKQTKTSNINRRKFYVKMFKIKKCWTDIKLCV